MKSSREIIRSTSVFVVGLVAMLIAIVLLGLYVERSTGKEPSVFPAEISWKEKPLRSALPSDCRVGS